MGTFLRFLFVWTPVWLHAAQETDRADIASVLQKHRVNAARIGIAAYSVRADRFLYEHNADRPFLPASNMKILTTATALDTLGEDFQFETRLFVSGDLQGDTLSGDLCVVAGGDPNLSGRDHDDDPLFLFRIWGARLLEMGVRRVRGRLVLVNDLFDEETRYPEWESHDPAAWYAAPVGAFALNDNCLDLLVRPGKPGRPCEVRVHPDTGSPRVVNRTLTVGKHRKPKPIVIERRGDLVTVRGERAAAGPAERYWVAVEDPLAFFGSALRVTLQRAGIRIEGKTEAGNLPSSARLVHVWRSPLSRTLQICNRHSQNLYAEMLFKMTGFRKTGVGSRAGGREAALAFLRSCTEGRIEGIEINDGSGLSPKNRVTPRQIVAVLRAMKDRPVFVDSLAVPGEDGTLRKRLKKFAGKLRAKTGYLAGVSALSGYLDVEGDTLLFSILNNDPRAHRSGIADEIVTALSRLRP